MSKVKNITKTNTVNPGKALTQKEYEAAIKVAEKGPFYSVEESKKMFEEWKKKNYKL